MENDLRYSLDGTKLAKLGWTAPISFEDSIARTVKFYVDNPEWLL
jgi:dTDP-D-glucose 4,6-dehydratase